MEKQEYFFSGSANRKLISEVEDFFVNKSPEVIRDSYKWNSELIYRKYSENFSGIIMDKFYSYPKIMREAITDYNLIGITLSLTIERNYANDLHHLENSEMVMFTVYTSKMNMVFLKLNSENFAESYLTNFMNVL